MGVPQWHSGLLQTRRHHSRTRGPGTIRATTSIAKTGNYKKTPTWMMR